MQCFFVAALFAFVCGVIHCNPDSSNTSLFDSITGVAENVRRGIEIRLTNMTEAIDHKWEIVHDIIEGDFEHHEEDVTEEVLGVDANGCDRKMRKDLEDRCDEEYEKVNDEAQLIEDESEKTEAVCCALEDFEKCSLRAYDKANCVTDKDAIRENLKAARLFLTVIANITCTQFRGQCAYYNSAVTGYSSYIVVLASALLQLIVYKLH